MKIIFKTSVTTNIITNVIFFTLFTFMSQTIAMETTENKKIILLTPEESLEYMETNKDFYLLDVRTHSEYKENKLEGSTLIPLQELLSRVDEIPIDKEILIYCRSGNRAQEAAKRIVPYLPESARVLVLNGFPIYP